MTVEIARSEQFSPIKNADRCRFAGVLPARHEPSLRALARGAGVAVARGADGEPVDLEIDPRLALDADEARERLAGHPPIVGADRARLR